MKFTIVILIAVSVLVVVFYISRLFYQGYKIFSKPEEKVRERNFKSCFGFHPDLYKQERYKKDALMRLRDLAKSVSSHYIKFGIKDCDYKNDLRSFMFARTCIEHFDPVFGRSIPHWTDMSAFAEEQLTKLETPPTPTEPDPTKRKSCSRCLRENPEVAEFCCMCGMRLVSAMKMAAA